MSGPRPPFIGTEALAQGLTQHRLRTRYRRIFPGIYVDRDTEPTLSIRIRAAWLWSGRTAVIGGDAAAAMWGARWVPAASTIDLFCAKVRAPNGIRTRHDVLPAAESSVLAGVGVSTPARTGFDIGRRGEIGQAVAGVDALLYATGITPADIALIADRHRHTRGLRQLAAVLALVDGGAESPRETWVRLLLLRAGFPAPVTQLEVVDERGRFVARLDMGWPELKVAVEYDGDQHRTDRAQYVRDVRRLELLARLGWIIVRVVKEDRPTDIATRVRDAMAQRGIEIALSANNR